MILISAEHDDQLLRKALSAHAFCVLAKPVSKNLVIYVVTKASRSSTDRTNRATPSIDLESAGRAVA